MTANPYESPGETSNATGTVAGWGMFVVKVLTGIVLLGLVVALLIPARRTAGEAARKAQCVNNLKQISLALLNYESTFKTFPPAYTMDAEGNRLHSWRSMILPYMEQGPIHKTINWGKPWNDPANRVAFETPISAFQCPSIDIPLTHTTYLAVVVPDGVFSGSDGRKVGEIVDERAMTLLIVEAEAARHVHWMSPEDVDEAWLQNRVKVEEQPHTSGVNVAFADGRVVPLDNELTKEQVRALLSIASGDNNDE